MLIFKGFLCNHEGGTIYHNCCSTYTTLPHATWFPRSCLALACFMSSVTEEYSPFQTLLKDVGRQLKVTDVRYMKYLLQGHVNKETLQNLDSGQELVEVLRKRGLVSERKLAFMRKLLVEAKCLKQVNLVDEFKEKLPDVAVVGE